MEDQNILNQILENTQEVKKVIIKEKKEKEETAATRAQKKFKMVGTKLNKQEQERFKKILEGKNTNANSYIKQLIFSGNEDVLEGVLEEENNTIKSQLITLSQENKSLIEENEILKTQVQNLKEEIGEIEEYGFWDLVKLRFFS